MLPRRATSQIAPAVCRRDVERTSLCPGSLGRRISLNSPGLLPHPRGASCPSAGLGRKCTSVFLSVLLSLCVSVFRGQTSSCSSLPGAFRSSNHVERFVGSSLSLNTWRVWLMLGIGIREPRAAASRAPPSSPASPSQREGLVLCWPLLSCLPTGDGCSLLSKVANAKSYYYFNDQY